MKSSRRALRLCIALAAAPLLSGCLYVNIKQPLDTDLAETKLGTKVGYAHNESILWLVAWGDAGTQAAAKQGDLKVVRHMDEEIYSVFFGAYTRYTTIVYGD